MVHPPYYDDAQLSDDIPLPKGPANCQVNQLIMYEDNALLRMPVGKGWTKTRLTHPITMDTIFGVLEAVPLPPAHMEGVKVSPPIAEGKGIRPTRRSSRRQDTLPA